MRRCYLSETLGEVRERTMGRPQGEDELKTCQHQQEGSVVTAEGKVGKTRDEKREPRARACQARGYGKKSGLSLQEVGRQRKPRITSG